MDNNIINILDLINKKQQLNQIVLLINNKLNNTFELAPGLQNVGNTCFHDSAIQLFYRITELTSFLIKNKQKYTTNQYLYNFITLLEIMKSRASTLQNNYLSSKDLQDLVITEICPIFGIDIITGMEKYQPGSQQDAQEFLNKILESIAVRDPINLIKIKFEVYHCSMDIQIPEYLQIKNDRGLYEIKDDEAARDFILTSGLLPTAFLDNCLLREQYLRQSIGYDFMLKLPIVDDEVNSIAEKINKIIYPLPDEIHNFEIIFKRPDNKSLNKAYLVKYNYITSKYLFIHLKIFESDIYGNTRKLIHKIKLTDDNGIFKFNYIDENGDDKIKLYELIGICYHSGYSLSSGHYIASIKHDIGWYDYDDIDYENKFREGPYKVYHNDYLKNPNSPQPYILLYKEISQ